MVKNYNVPVPGPLAQDMVDAIRLSGGRFLSTPYRNHDGSWSFSYSDGSTTEARVRAILGTKPVVEVRKDGRTRRLLRRLFGRWGRR